jgi:hypothetical protein
VEQVKYRYRTLEDFLISNPLSVDGQLDDGWGAIFPVKGREVETTILFADISSFSKRTLELSPTETLIFVNNFFTWITAEALRNRPGIVDKYIGDEVMVIFSEEFGSKDSFVDAVQTARWMAEHDVLAFEPHMGIAGGVVTVGFVGTPLKYDCSVFGVPVALAARCAGIPRPVPRATAKPQPMVSSSIVFPAELWKGRSFKEILPAEKYRMPDGTIQEQPHSWELLPPRKVRMKNMSDIEIREIVNRTIHIPTQSAEERARESLRVLQRSGNYRQVGTQGR